MIFNFIPIILLCDANVSLGCYLLTIQGLKVYGAIAVSKVWSSKRRTNMYLSPKMWRLMSVMVAVLPQAWNMPLSPRVRLNERPSGPQPGFLWRQ